MYIYIYICKYKNIYTYRIYIYKHKILHSPPFPSPSLSTGLEQLEAPGLTTPVNGNRVPGNVALAGLTGRAAGLLLPLGPFPGRRAAVGSAKPGMVASTNVLRVKIK